MAEQEQRGRSERCYISMAEISTSLEGPQASPVRPSKNMPLQLNDFFSEVIKKN
jgi:hypothetical protein